MRTRTPLILALLAGLLGAYIWLVERHHATTDGARAAAPRLFPKIARGQITEIRIERRGPAGKAGTFAISQPAGVAGPVAGDLWRLSPGDKPTAPGAVDDLLDAIDAQEIDRGSDAPAAVSGLDPPAVTVTITAAGRRFGLRLGNADASGRGVFVARDGDARTLVVGRRLLDLVDRPAAAFRDRRLFPVALAGRAASVSWMSKGEAQRTLRVRGANWLNEKGLFVSPAAVAQALRGLGELKAIDFPAPPPAALHDPPDSTLDVTTAAAEAVDHQRRWQARFWRGQGCSGAGWLGELTAADDNRSTAPDWLCLDGLEAEQAWRALELAHQRRRRLLSVDVEQMGGVSIADQRGGRLRLRRERGEWRIVEPAVGYAADGDVIVAWLGRLAATSLDDHAPSATGRPSDQRRLIIEGLDGQTMEAVDVATPRGGAARVQREGEAEAAKASAALYAELDPEPLRFRSRAVLSLARSDVESVEISSPSGHIEARKGPGDTWQATAAGPGAEIDTAALESLLGVFTNLKATRFPAPPPARFTPERTIEITVREGETPHREKLELAKPTGVFLARLAGRSPTVFEISLADHADLIRPIVKTADESTKARRR